MSMQHRYLRRPEQVDAWRVDLEKLNELPVWLKHAALTDDKTELAIPARYGFHFAKPGYWVIRHSGGEGDVLEVMSDEGFQMLYVYIGDWHGIKAYDIAKGLPFYYKVEEAEDRCVVRFDTMSILYDHMEQTLAIGRQTNRNSVHALIRDLDKPDHWYVHSNYYLAYGAKEDEVLQPFRTSLEEDIILLHNSSGYDYFTLIKPGVRFDLPILKTKIGTFRLPLREKVT